MNIFRRSQKEAGHTLAILGIGFIEALPYLAKHATTRIIAASQRGFPPQMAKACGSEEDVGMDDHGKIIEKISQLTNGNF